MVDILRHRLANGLYWTFVIGIGGLALVYLVAPVVIALLMSFTAGESLRFPPQGLSLRWYAALLDPAESGPIHAAAYNSLKIAFWAVVGSLAVAVPASVGMAKLGRRSSAFVEPLLLAPLVLPSLIYGLAALIAATLVGIGPSFGLVVAGHVVVFGPLMFRSVSAVAGQIDPSLEEASTTLGASRLRTFVRVTLPLLLPGIGAGAFLVLMQSLDNVSITLFLADPVTSVLPLRMFQMLQEFLDPRVAAISGVLIGGALLALLAARRVSPLFRNQ